MTQPQPFVSIIVRAKNEERWIVSCLTSVARQTYQNFEVVLVDNRSTDQTVAKASPYTTTFVEIDEFLPGRAINEGIRASRGDVIVCLSGHCIPTDEHWLANLIAGLADPDVGGVYGRQEPLSYSSPLDKRDLLITFGLDPRVQVKDSFFHNANSAFRREVWEQHPFDEDVTNIEDRIWARQILAGGYKILYTPDASVYHHHGIHHSGNPARAAQIVRIIEGLEGPATDLASRGLENLTVVAVVPTRGEPIRVGSTSLAEFTIRDVLAAELVDRVVVATDNEAMAQLAKGLGAEVPFLRPMELSEDYVGIGDVLSYALQQLEERRIIPDLVVVAEETHPFRPPGLIDQIILQLVREGADSVIAAKPETRRVWVRNGGGSSTIGSSPLLPRQLRDSKMYVGLFGLGCVTHPEFVRDGTLLGTSVAMHEVDDPFCAVEIRSRSRLDDAMPFLRQWRGKT